MPLYAPATVAIAPTRTIRRRSGPVAAGLITWARAWIDRTGGLVMDLGRPGRFLNLDGNAVINRGGPPAGAHSDIFHPELVWAGLAAAGLAGSP